ncbi:MAG: tetratricopeptide repeat protein [Acidobacteria bacterium]|nr:tetratricopeptide repeat protein [Acidobacteriota bacterium]
MKRCPQCGREYDNTMMFCLDDGTELLYGPASTDGPQTAILSEPGAVATGFPSGEPQTAILSEPPASAGGQFDGENPTRQFTQTTAAAEPQKSISEPSEKQSFSAHRAAKPLLAALGLAVILIGGFFGYRFFASNTKQIESIAVMPFVNESGNPDLEYLSDGMTESLITSLSKVPNLAVKSRSTVFFYEGKETSPKKIGDELGVQAVLLGRVGGHGDDLRLSLELVNTRTQDVMWAEEYNRQRADLVSLQREIARDVSKKLKSKLSGADEAKIAKASTDDPEAYQAYLKGRYYFNLRGAENLSRSIEQFKNAIALDPNFALAFSGLADSYAVYSDYSGAQAAEIGPLVRTNAERAIALDPQLAEPHATLGILNVQNRNWDDALRESKKSVDLDPNYPTGVQWYASILLDLGRYEEAAVMMQRAHDLDPVSPAISDGLSNTYEAQDDFDAAIENSKRYIELNPAFPGTYRNLGLYYSITGRNAEAVEQAEKAVQIERSSYLLAALGYVYGEAGKREQAMALARELETRFADNSSPGRYIAEIYAGLGEKQKAMEWLEKDFQTKNGRLAEVTWTIPFRSMRDYPPFENLLKRMGLRR